MVLDLAAPIIMFYGLRWAGVGVFVALIAGAIAPTLNMLVKVTKDRRVDGLAAAVLGVLLLSAGVSLIDGSPQFLAAKDGVLTAAWGGWFFISLRGTRPLTFRSPDHCWKAARSSTSGNVGGAPAERGVMGPAVAAVAAFPAHMDNDHRDLGRSAAHRRRRPSGDGVHASH